MATPSIDLARNWIGRVMIDRDHNIIGKVVNIYLDNQTGQPEWAVVRTGLFGMRSSFVPLAEATEVDNEVQVPHPRTLVKEAPSIEPDGHLSPAEEAELFRHYGLDYGTVPLDEGAAADHPGTAPAGQPQMPIDDQRADATGTSAPQSPSSPAEPRSDTAAGAEPAATVSGELVESAGEDRLPVGEGVSRPFVYETPGHQDGAAGTSRNQPGQVRLRRYLVTEVVTETDSGQRHELQIQREPVSDDAEVDAIPPATNHQGQPISHEETGPEPNDWFSEGGDPRH